jgi:exodeoxyribonuclease V alpha subunit
MSDYDANNPTHIDIMEHEFNCIKAEEWEAFIEIAQLPEHKHTFSFNNIGMLNTALKKVGVAKFLSPKQLRIILSIVEKIEELKADDYRSEETAELYDSTNYASPASNVTLRVAWHDNKWNGAICNDPENNIYCSGLNSLLSERIRRRKDENIESEIAFSGKSLNDIDYVPPCFWSINLFSDHEIDVKHDNPAAPNLDHIDQKIPSKSLVTWPFAVSFCRSKEERGENGAYPKNLASVRIPRFNKKLQEERSIGFMYAKFSNPITEEDQQYLVVGAGIIAGKESAEDIQHFGPPSEIEKIREKPKYRNFPTMNWAMRLSFDDHTTVRMPYHEYLAEADTLDDDKKDKFLDKIKVAITEPELDWCFKYVAMDIGDDEAIYILSKMRKSLLICRDDGVVDPQEMQEKINTVEGLLQFAWESRSYFPGFVSLSRIVLSKKDEPEFVLEQFYEDFKDEEVDHDILLRKILDSPLDHEVSRKYASHIRELSDKLRMWGLSNEKFLSLSMLSLTSFQFERILDGKLNLPSSWFRSFDDDVERSHSTDDIIKNPYLLYEDYEYWENSHDNVYGEELDVPIDLFKIDIAYFPDTRYQSRIELQREIDFVDRRRIRALLLRHLNTLENTGDCFTDAETLQKELSGYPLFYEVGESYRIPERFFYPLDSDYSNHFLEEPKKLVFVEANETMYYYLARVYNAEKNIEGKISELLRAHNNSEVYQGLQTYLDNSVRKLNAIIGEGFESNGFLEERDLLYRDIFSSRLFVLAGSAGSGKSYEILNIIKQFEEQDQTYLLLAPTGKAALRLKSDPEFPGIRSSTIDKFIADVKRNNFTLADINAINNLIVDEMSMVDLLKFAELISFFNFKMPGFKRLILVGDPNQLPAIGYGRVLSDTISFLSTNEKYHTNSIQLETNCRSELDANEVLKLANAYRQNGEIDLSLRDKFRKKEHTISKGFQACYWTNMDELYTQIKAEFVKLAVSQGYEGSLAEQLNQMNGLSKDGNIRGNSSKLSNFQILTPYHAQYSGAVKINHFIQTEFKSDLPYTLRKNLYKNSDKIIRTKNYYDSDQLLLSNGTIGLIINERSEKFYYESASGMESTKFNDIRKAEQEFFELAYAITIHKSQGSGFKHLFLVLPARYGLLSKELIYTALTRTQSSITVFIQNVEGARQNVLEIALERSFSGARRTSLMLDKPYRYYDLEPEPGVFVESRIELMIYHLLMKKRDELGKETFNFEYENKPVVNGETVEIKTDFTVYCNNKTWYWEHLGLLSQRKYNWVWKNIKSETYKTAGIWDSVITTEESNGIIPSKIDSIIDLIYNDEIDTEDKYTQYSNHHYCLR